ncbi:MAG: IS91 family transposase [Longimicrobiales bacterium]|nr:IS91 family transposase [Longimicrobiales bacterium]
MAARPGRPELADIVRAHGLDLGHLPPHHRRVLDAIGDCRTAALGGHVLACDRCGHREISYNSCRDRHCPKCQALDRVRWQEARAEDLLPVPYFHLVFTIPAALHPLFRQDLRLTYDLLFRAVAETLATVAADPAHLGARLGFTTILHTWTQTLLYHPHLHVIVPGGGLDPRMTRWIPARRGFFLPVRVLSAVFRGKLLAFLEAACAQGRLPAPSGTSVARLLRRAARKKWVVYSKPPFAGPEGALTYLGRYTHRIAFSNERLLALEDGQVRFRFRDRAHGNVGRTMTLPALDFLRRFLLHVLPPGFVRIRHYGLFANSVRRERLDLCRTLLGVRPGTADPTPTESWDELLLRLTGRDVTRCPQCRKGRLCVVEDFPPGVVMHLPEPCAASP